ncbi:hypothetical protein G6F24_018737 [Rhizopus arrhizus]|nr:hypothetical protein G6F24_018737 [Rhizopus arrhizus]
MIRSKLPDVGTPIFTVMSRLAIEHKAINLGQGFPDFDPDPALCALVTRAMAEGHNQRANCTAMPTTPKPKSPSPAAPPEL